MRHIDEIFNSINACESVWGWTSKMYEISAVNVFTKRRLLCGIPPYREQHIVMYRKKLSYRNDIEMVTKSSHGFIKIIKAAVFIHTIASFNKLISFFCYTNLMSFQLIIECSFLNSVKTKTLHSVHSQNCSRNSKINCLPLMSDLSQEIS